MVELMVVIAVVGILLSVAAPSLIDLLNRRRVQAVAAELSTDLAYARAEAGLRPTNLLVKFNGSGSMSCYSIIIDKFQGVCDCTLGQGNACTGKRLEVKTTQVPANIGVSVTPIPPELGWGSMSANTMKFNSPQMTAEPADFSIAVKGNRGSELQVQVNAMGRVRICSPNNSMPGVDPC